MKKFLLTPIIFILIHAGQVSASQLVVPHSPPGLLPVDYAIDSVTKNTTAGLLYFDFDYHEGKTLDRDTYGFCIEPTKSANWGYAEIVSLETYSASSKIDIKLFQNAAWLMDKYVDSSNSFEENTGLQLAVWDAIYKFELLDTTDSSISYWYDQYMGGLNSFKGSFTAENYRIVDFQDKQDMLIRTVPLPATFFLMGLGLVGISSARRKKIFKA